MTPPFSCRAVVTRRLSYAAASFVGRRSDGARRAEGKPRARCRRGVTGWRHGPGGLPAGARQPRHAERAAARLPHPRPDVGRRRHPDAPRRLVARPQLRRGRARHSRLDHRGRRLGPVARPAARPHRAAPHGRSFARRAGRVLVDRAVGRLRPARSPSRRSPASSSCRPSRSCGRSSSARCPASSAAPPCRSTPRRPSSRSWPAPPSACWLATTVDTGWALLACELTAVAAGFVLWLVNPPLTSDAPSPDPLPTDPVTDR